MRFLEALNRILVGMLLSLVLLQAGLLFFMKNMEDQAQFRLVQNTSTVDAECGKNSFNDEMYWPLQNENLVSSSSCEGSECTFSHLTWQQESQSKELQLIAVQSAPPFRWGDIDQGGVVRVRIKPTPKPLVLALASRQRLEWSFQVDAGARIEKVIVATPEVVWLQGLPPQTVIEYLPKEKMCSYPYAWEEAFNPDNEFRVLGAVLKKMTGLELNSFQGAMVGKEFRIPLFDQVRSLASEDKEAPVERIKAAEFVKPQRAQNEVMGAKNQEVIWKRVDKSIFPERIKSYNEEIVLPENTQQVVTVAEQVFIVKKDQLQRWDSQQKTFSPMPTPKTLPLAQYIKAITASETAKALFVYNDERGGEMLRYDLENQKWTLLSSGYAYNLEALYYDETEQSLKALASRGPHLTQLLNLDEQAKVKEAVSLKNKISFDKKNWKVQLKQANNMLVVRFHQPVWPQGQDIPLEM